MRRLVASCLWALAQALAAQPYPEPPQPAPPRPLQIAAPTEQRLDNGLRVVVAERHGWPLVSAQLLVLSGAEADPPQAAGLAALTAGLLTRGTRRHSAPELAAAAEALGGSLSSEAGWNQSSVGITVTTPRLDAALALVAEAVREPAFAADELERLRTETLDQLKVAYARPGTLAALASNRMLFGDGAYGHPRAGTPASLARLTAAEVRRLHRERYRPDNAVLVLAGDIGPAEARALAERHFGDWPAAPGELPSTPAAAGEPSAQPVMLIDMGPSEQAALALALPLPPAGSADEDAGEVANAVLGGGYSSRLNLEIRVKRGLSYGAGSAFDARRHAGVLRAAVQTRNASAAELYGLLQAQLDALAATAVPDTELAARKAALIGGFSRSVETTAGLAAQVAGLLADGRPASALTTRIAALDAVDAAQVMRYAQQHFGAAARRVAVAGDAGVFGAALRAALPSGAAPLTVEAGHVDLGP